MAWCGRTHDGTPRPVRSKHVPDGSADREPLVAYGESVGPPCFWSYPTLGPYRMQCDVDPFEERTIRDPQVNEQWDTDPENALYDI